MSADDDDAAAEDDDDEEEEAAAAAAGAVAAAPPLAFHSVRARRHFSCVCVAAQWVRHCGHCFTGASHT